MGIERAGTGPDAGTEDLEETTRPEPPPPPPDRPGTPGYPSRAESRRIARAANDTPTATSPPRTEADPADEHTDAKATTGWPKSTRPPENTDEAVKDAPKPPKSDGRFNRESVDTRPRPPHRHPLDASIAGGDEPRLDIPQFTPEQLTRLHKAEDTIRNLADKYGVRIDYTTHPIDPANALELNKAITRIALEYPNAFRKVENIMVLDPHGMAEAGSGLRALGHAIHKGQRPAGRDPLEPGIYLNQIRFIDKHTTDEVAAADRQTGHNVSGTAEGTLYHEFGHVIHDDFRRNPEVKSELASELRNAGLSVDQDTLSWATPPGPKAVEVGLSRYGSTDAREMLAEGFSEWKLTQEPRRIARAIGSVIDKHFKES